MGQYRQVFVFPDDQMPREAAVELPAGVGEALLYLFAIHTCRFPRPTAFSSVSLLLGFLGVGTTEKVADVQSAGSIGGALVMVLILTLPAGVSVVLIRMRMVPPQ